MPLPTLRLDDRRFQDIVDEAKGMIPRYCPEWTDHNVSDPGITLAQFALRWVIDQPGVSTVIPGARNPEQVRGNAGAAALAPLTEDQLAGVREVYDRLIRRHVHDRW